MQPCSQPRYGLIEAENPTSGLSLRVMITFAFSGETVVVSWAGASSSGVQPSSKLSRSWLSKRPLALERAPRPRTCCVNVDMDEQNHSQENKERTSCCLAGLSASRYPSVKLDDLAAERERGGMSGGSGATEYGFVFPVIAWAPEPVTGDACDDGTRGFLTARDVVTTCFPDDDRRLGWTFVDVEGRSWEAVSSRVIGRADPWWARALPKWLWHPRYRLALDFEERPSMPFDAVKTRLFSAVSANPRYYREYARDRRDELRAAENLNDLVMSAEARAIRELRPTPLWSQWLFWEGRCSRITFVGFTAAFLTAAWVGVSWLRLPPLVLLTTLGLGLLLWISTLVRRLHDLRLTGWWSMAWLVASFPSAVIVDSISDPTVKAGAAATWQIATLVALAFLALAPGTRGPNRYGLSRR